MEQLSAIVEFINSIVWGAPAQIALGVTGTILTLGLGFMPWKKIGYAFRLLLKPPKQDAKGDITPFKALMTALSATVGTGNIAGVAIAISLGGPGAIFYMWVFALLGMATKYAEAVCAITYREVDKDGLYVGGPMYYLRNGVGKFAPGLGKWLGAIFAILGIATSFGGGGATQINSLAAVTEQDFFLPTWITGIIVAILLATIIFGGIKSIAVVAGKLVPAMIILYLGSAIIIIALNLSQIPEAIVLIFKHAFEPIAATGGFAGATVAAAIRFGVARGVSSNESGLGSAAIAHAAAKTNNPVHQGLIAMLGTFIDTLVVCTTTALVIIVSGIWTHTDVDGQAFTGAILTSLAFANTIPGSQYIVTITTIIFAFTTLLGWAYYGERCWQYLFSKKTIIIFRITWLGALIPFANFKVIFVWLMSDALNGLMILPNLIGLIILTPVILKVTRKYFATQSAEQPNNKIPIQP